MASSQENLPGLEPLKPQCSFPYSPVFPPLPLIPPPDVSKRTDSTRKAPLTCAPQNDPHPRRFGTKITNTLATSEYSSSVHTELKSPPLAVRTAAQNIFQPNQLLSPSEKKLGVNVKSWWEQCEDEPANCVDKSTFAATISTEHNTDLRLSTKKLNAIRWDQKLQPERTIWSVTPNELAELAREMAVMKSDLTEPARKLSYAEASKRNLSGCVEEQPSQGPKAERDEQQPRTFKKYYGLPIISCNKPFHSRDTPHAPTQKSKMEGPFSSETEIKPSSESIHGHVSGLSANTPIFHPRQTTETNELIQLLNVSLTSKKVAPHMDWWPGDWKCTNCGNHVLLSGVH